nr:MAG TPA: hypothetical protein [Bacteriophage sp.]
MFCSCIVHVLSVRSLFTNSLKGHFSGFARSSITSECIFSKFVRSSFWNHAPDF